MGTHETRNMCITRFRCMSSAIRGRCRDPGYIDFRQGDVALDCHVELRINSRWGCIFMLITGLSFSVHMQCPMCKSKMIFIKCNEHHCRHGPHI